ncbi:MAG: trypsin-like serine protease, partial [Planctomycetes bacterium]|nr:trypsin-like serine protease [Planctomycetota bacterium]
LAAITTWAGCTPLPGGSTSCPSNASTFEKMNEAAYAVVLRIRVGPGENDVRFFTLGTAFAVDDRLLATNAHVTEFFNGLTGIQVDEVVAVQSGTGTVVTLLRALTHPDYTGDPLSSPDIGLFTTQEELSNTLTIASDTELLDLDLGEELLLAGFPGDVQDLFEITPNETVPQATSLTGNISALRSHSTNEVVTAENTDVIQHQIPTTPGTSGSALVLCGKVAAVHNAGTVTVIVTVNAQGDLIQDRTAAANNNFGVHAKFLREMISLFEAQSIQGFELPPPFQADGGQNPGGGAGGGGGGQQGPTFSGTYAGGVTTPATAAHNIAITVANDGSLTGTSSWANTGNFTLTGSVSAAGEITFRDNADVLLNFNQGVYVGTVNATTGVASGQYFESNSQTPLANWTANRQ